MSVYTHIIALMGLAIFISYINYRFLKLQTTITIMASALIISIILLGFDLAGFHALHPDLARFVKGLHFNNLVLGAMLGLLLFAGALTVDFPQIKQQGIEIACLAFLGTTASMFLIGSSVYFISHWISTGLSYPLCLLFGAIISPTDPIAVLAIFKEINAPKRLTTLVSAESLFNDGVAVVLFLTVWPIAFSHSSAHPSDIILLFLRQSAGGVLYGLVLGYIAHRMLRPIDDFKVECMVVFGLVMGGYTLAKYIDVSGLLAIVTMGIFFRNYKYERTLGKPSRQQFEGFWEIIDELLNAVLFLLLGFEILTIQLKWEHLILSLFAIPVAIIVRYIVVAVPISLISFKRKQSAYTITILTWGGLRGGLAVALALSLPNHNRAHNLIVCMTYAVVLFTILVQGLTIKPLAKRAKALEESK